MREMLNKVMDFIACNEVAETILMFFVLAALIIGICFIAPTLLMVLFMAFAIFFFTPLWVFYLGYRIIRALECRHTCDRD